MNYYKEELKKLKDSEYFKNLIVSDDQGSKTKTLSINLESIPVLIEFLKKEQKRLENK